MKNVFNTRGAISAFRDGHNSPRNSQGNVFGENAILFDYGYHFPMAVRVKGLFIINGDRYSMTTARHQREVIEICTPNVQIPFSALVQMIDDETGLRQSFAQVARYFANGDIKIIDHTSDKWEPYTYKNKEGETVESQRHFLGDVLLDYKGKRYLSAFDHQEPERLNPYFLTTLKGKPATVAAAYAGMIPESVKDYESKGDRDTLRQGEWFFIPIELSRYQMTSQTKLVGRMVTWARNSESGTHIATEVRKHASGLRLVRGIIRHKPAGRRPQHAALKLGVGAWYVPVKNTAGKSWQSSGNVD